MRRLAIAVAAAAALMPATLGLVGNSSFAESVPTPVPPSAQVLPPVDDHGGDRPSGTPTAEPGDDHGGDRSSGSSASRHGSDDSVSPTSSHSSSHSSSDSSSDSSGRHGSDDRGGDDH